VSIFERLTLEEIKEIIKMVAKSIMKALHVEEIDKYNLDVDKEYDQVEVEFYQWDTDLQISCTFVGEDLYVEIRDVENVSAKEIEKAIIKTYGEILVRIQ